MLRLLAILGLCLGISGCAAWKVIQSLFGYIPPPEETTISEELKLEYDRCLKSGEKVNCAQKAYDVVRIVKGLEPRKVPEGIVIILQGDGGHDSEAENRAKEEQQKLQDRQN